MVTFTVLTSPIYFHASISISISVFRVLKALYATFWARLFLVKNDALDPAHYSHFNKYIYTLISFEATL